MEVPEVLASLAFLQVSELRRSHLEEYTEEAGEHQLDEVEALALQLSQAVLVPEGLLQQQEVDTVLSIQAYLLAEWEEASALCLAMVALELLTLILEVSIFLCISGMIAKTRTTPKSWI